MACDGCTTVNKTESPDSERKRAVTYPQTCWCFQAPFLDGSCGGHLGQFSFRGRWGARATTVEGTLTLTFRPLRNELHLCVSNCGSCVEQFLHVGATLTAAALATSSSFPFSPICPQTTAGDSCEEKSPNQEKRTAELGFCRLLTPRPQLLNLSKTPHTFNIRTEMSNGL
eukprot:3939208-Rhodomonas_salina.2